MLIVLYVMMMLTIDAAVTAVVDGWRAMADVMILVELIGPPPHHH